MIPVARREVLANGLGGVSRYGMRRDETGCGGGGGVSTGVFVSKRDMETLGGLEQWMGKVSLPSQERSV